MQSKLQDLQEKLQAEEAEKRELAHKYEEIQNRCDQLQDQVNSNQEQQHEGKVCDIFIWYFMKELNFYNDQPLQFLHWWTLKHSTEFIWGGPIWDHIRWFPC